MPLSPAVALRVLCVAWLTAVSGSAPIYLAAVAPRGPAIALVRVLTLGDDEGPGVLGFPTAVTRDAQGRFLVVTEAETNAILVFDSAGRFVRSVGSRGDGPGEYRWILALAKGPGDTIHVYDITTRRRTVLSPNLRAIRQHALPGSFFRGGAAVLTDGSVILNGIRRTSDGFGFAFQMLNAEGTYVRSFGAHHGVLTPRTVYQVLNRPFAVDAAGRVLAGFAGRYGFEEWDARQGTRVREIPCDAPWFLVRPEGDLGGPSRDHPPYSLVRAIALDESGGVRVATLVQDARWRAQLTETRGPDGPYLDAKDDTRYLDSRLEIVERASGTVIASTQVDQVFFAFLGPDHLVSVRDAASGVVKLDVWRIRVVGQG